VSGRSVLEIEVSVRSEDSGHLVEFESAFANLLAESDLKPLRQMLFSEQRSAAVLWQLEWQSLPDAMAFVSQPLVAAFLGAPPAAVTINSCRVIELGTPAAGTRYGDFGDSKPRPVRGRLLRFTGGFLHAES